MYCIWQNDELQKKFCITNKMLPNIFRNNYVSIWVISGQIKNNKVIHKEQCKLALFHKDEDIIKLFEDYFDYKPSYYIGTKLLNRFNLLNVNLKQMLFKHYDYVREIIIKNKDLVSMCYFTFVWKVHKISNPLNM